MNQRKVLGVIFSISLLVVLAYADVPSKMSYQGRLTDDQGVPVSDGDYSIQFRIYTDEVGGSILWQEPQNVAVADGLFSVLLGDVNSIPDTVFTGPTRWLGIQVSLDPELSPRKAIVSVGYAFHALGVDTADYALSAPAAQDDDWVISGDTIYHLDGNVGIGTQQPTAKVEIDQNEDARALFINNDGNDEALKIRTVGSASALNIIRDSPSPTDVALLVREQQSSASRNVVHVDNHGNGTALRIQNRGSGYGIIVDEGNVGIGTTDPFGKLEIQGNGNLGLAFFDMTNTEWGSLRFQRSGVDKAAFGLWNTAAGTFGANDFYFATHDDDWHDVFALKNDGTAAYFNDGVNVGIGTTAPFGLFEVAGTYGDGVYITNDNTNYGSHQFLYRQVGGTNAMIEKFGRAYNGVPSGLPNGTYYTQIGSDAIIFVDKDLANERMRLHTNGRVGIGATSPQSKLHVADMITVGIENTTDGEIQLEDSGGKNHDPGIRTNAAADLVLRAHASGSSIRLETGNPESERMTILGTGNIGIGTPSPSAKLDVAGNALVNGTLTVNGPGGSVNAITSNTEGAYSGVAGLNSGSGPGVYGESHSAQSHVGGVMGKAEEDGGSGIYGETWSLGKLQPPDTGSSCAVHGWAPASGASVGGAALAVLGRVNSYQGSNASVPCGVFGWATATSGTNAGVWGETHSSGGYGVYSAGDMAVDGDFYCNGDKNAVVKTSEGTRALSCIESPEVWFEDFGEGQLKGGRVHMELDPLFLETVTINDQHPMKVFIQLRDNCEGVYVKTHRTGFEVFELRNGVSDAAFSYRVVAKRKGYENERLELKEIPSRGDSPTVHWKK